MGPKHNLEAHLHAVSGPNRRDALRANFLYSLPGQNRFAAGENVGHRDTNYAFTPSTPEKLALASQVWHQLKQPVARNGNGAPPGHTAPVKGGHSFRTDATDFDRPGNSSFRNLNGVKAVHNEYSSISGQYEATVPLDRSQRPSVPNKTGRQDWQSSFTGSHATQSFQKASSATVTSQQVTPLGGKSFADDVAFVRETFARTGVHQASNGAGPSYASPMPQTGARNWGDASTTPTAEESFADANEDFDDEDLLESIDLDQVVAQYQEQRLSTAKVQTTPVTSFRTSGDFAGSQSTFQPSASQAAPVPPVFCSHGLQMHLCGEASSHLQDMKDELLQISEELLDDDGEMDPKLSEELRTKRSRLSREIKALQQLLSADEERRRSHAAASSPWGPSPAGIPPSSARSAGTNGTPVPSTPFSFHPPTTSAQATTPGVHPTSWQAPPAAAPASNFQNDYGSGGAWAADPASGGMDRARPELAAVPSREVDFTVPRQFRTVSYTDGVQDPQWKRTDFPWRREIERLNLTRFGNHQFRANQREIINATLSNRDVFVLMPTGGGKSLTYQLPAVYSSGVTLVVSPLISLIQDQIMHLTNANVEAVCLSSRMDWMETRAVYQELESPYCKYKLLYVTPEKIARSDSFFRTLEMLHRSERLARIVIDEAHCVSQWGHDFRPDYQGLKVLKQNFPAVPVMALTATATASVKEDVVQALGLVNCVVFKQTFNRPNIVYEVRPKKKSLVEDINKFVRENHPYECGIIYCLSRTDCEKIANKLKELGHKAHHYHANMDEAERSGVQRAWSEDKINIICATIAFGMGINKPDVRFVIHHSMPKSLEGYHQESGRAGRDGLKSTCILYYTYGDMQRIKHMLTANFEEQRGQHGRSYESAEAQFEVNMQNLHRMVAYCDNDVDCRRTLQLAHFGENFDAGLCKGTCDNCARGATFVETDVTEAAQQLIRIIHDLGQRSTLSYVVDVFRGANTAAVKKQRHDQLPLHGAGKKFTKGEVERILHRMVSEQILVEDLSKSENYGSILAYLRINDRPASDVVGGRMTLTVKFAATKKPELPTTSRKQARPAPDESPIPNAGALPARAPAPPRMTAEEKAFSARVYEEIDRRRSAWASEESKGTMFMLPYHIFPNTTLQTIAKKLPVTLAQLGEIDGIKKKTMKQRGPEIVAVIRQMVADRDGVPYVPEEVPEKAPKSRRAKPAKRGREAGDSAQKEPPASRTRERRPYQNPESDDEIATMMDDSDEEFGARPPAAPGPVKRSRDGQVETRDGLVDLDENQGWRDTRRPSSADLASHQWGTFQFQKVYK
ncbi:DNA helicase [Klebsormidium nitens]|uniref:DNA 3'-5' helicase n=1 Tax=Klebsormidium nitens TaxID=105231 RepID=A0A1Y1I1E8_KLENI|nr:DNA helicase [Klebsormidium nitens]|eukprot:GAQ84734.1 DNA helicase [Klebsormidium nitens]